LARARDLDDATIGRESAYVAEHTNELDHRRFAPHDPKVFSLALAGSRRYQPRSGEILVLRPRSAVGKHCLERELVVDPDRFEPPRRKAAFEAA
jgi:hypothetical protein